MTKVYVVHSGEYSSQSVEGVFSTREAAEALEAEIDKVDGSGYIEQFILDARAGERSMPQWALFIGCESGATTPPKVCYWMYPRTFEDAEVEGARPWSGNYRNLPEFDHLTEGEPVILVRSGISAEHALKLTAEARQEWLRSRAVAGVQDR